MSQVTAIDKICQRFQQKALLPFGVEKTTEVC